MNTVKKCLFGGALLGAGLCSTASADFDWFGASVDAVGGGGNFDNHWGSGNFDLTATGYYGSAHASADADGFSMSAVAIDFASASRGGVESYVHVQYADFYVTEDMSVTIEWDFSNYTMSYIIFDGLLLNGSGSLEIDFLAFDFHTFNGHISASPFSTLDGSASTFSITENTVNVVPLPPAAFGGLAMLAGLGAYRRVRR